MTAPSFLLFGRTSPARPNLLFFPRDWQDGASREEFRRLYRRLVRGRARRAGLSPAEAEVVAEDVFRRLSPLIQELEHGAERGIFRAQLIRLTHWRIAEKFRRDAAPPPRTDATRELPPRLEGAVAAVPAAVDRDDEWDREWEQHLLVAAAERVARRVEPRDFQVFELRVRQRWPLLKVAAEIGMNPVAVFFSGRRVARLVRDESRQLRNQLG